MALSHYLSLRNAQCPYCGGFADVTVSLPGQQDVPPQDGDISVCLDCVQPSIIVISLFGAALRRTTAAETAQFAVDHGHLADVVRTYNALHRPEHPPWT